MITLRADLHIHTLLSPCGDLEMTPAAIVGQALAKGLQIIGIADHNSTRQAPLVSKIGTARGLLVLCGAEVTTREEVHCLAYFPDDPARETFQKFLDRRLPDIACDPYRFGHQVQVDEQENIVFTEKRLLIAAIDAGIDETEAEVHRLGGIFIPAHIDRPRFSLISQLGFIPSGLKADALEVTAAMPGNQILNSCPGSHAAAMIAGSDAHCLRQIGSRSTKFIVREATFRELSLALKGAGGRSIKIIS